MAAWRTGIGSLPILFRFSLPILAASRTGIGSLPILENLGNAPEPVMERRILVGAAEPVLDMQQYRFWHITAIGQKITSNGSLPLWVVTYTHSCQEACAACGAAGGAEPPEIGPKAQRGGSQQPAPLGSLSAVSQTTYPTSLRSAARRMLPPTREWHGDEASPCHFAIFMSLRQM